MDITNWFFKKPLNPIKKEQKSVQYFYLNYDKKTTEWLKDKPLESTILGIISWHSTYNKTKIDTVICCSTKFYNFNNNDTDFVTKSTNVFNIKHISILKSQLQKCARRRQSELGIKTATSMSKIEDYSNHICQIGLFEMLRRITIIVIEDSVLLQDYGVLVWFQCALSKGFRAKRVSMIWILNIITKIMRFEWKDSMYTIIKLDDTCIVKKIYESGVSNEYKTLLYTIQLRNSFRGMQCDVIMLDKSTLLWLNRMESKSTLIKYLDTAQITYIEKNNEYTDLNKSEILLESLDFHCTNVCDKIQTIVDIDTDKIKQLIWNYSSGVNNRLELDPEYRLHTLKKDIVFSKDIDDWMKIEPIFRMCCNEIKMDIV